MPAWYPYGFISQPCAFTPSGAVRLSFRLFQPVSGFPVIELGVAEGRPRTLVDEEDSDIPPLTYHEIGSGQWHEADGIRALFKALEELRNQINPIRVLHEAVSLAFGVKDPRLHTRRER